MNIEGFRGSACIGRPGIPPAAEDNKTPHVSRNPVKYEGPLASLQSNRISTLATIQMSYGKNIAGEHVASVSSSSIQLRAAETVEQLNKKHVGTHWRDCS